MGKRFAILIGAVALGAALMAVGASADFRSVHDPRGDTRCYHDRVGEHPPPCSDRTKRTADIVRATAGHEGTRLRHTIRVAGKIQDGALDINTDSDRDCERVLYFQRGRPSQFRKCGGRVLGRARMDFHRHSVKIVFRRGAIGNPKSYGWRAWANDGITKAHAVDSAPKYPHYIQHRLAQPAAAAAVQQLSCGDTITTDTTLHKDLVNCPNNGIVIGANGITLDLNGHLIDGDETRAAGCDPNEFCDVGVLNDGHDGVTVRHGSVRDFDVGVYGLNVAHNRLLGISASRNGSIGIFYTGSSPSGSSRILVRNCSGNRTVSNDTAGLMVLESDHVRILNSSFRHNANIGIDTADSNNILIKGNVVSGNGDERFLMQGGEGFRITHNRVVRNRGGITLRGSLNVIKRNRVLGAQDAIRIGEGHGNLVAHNLVAHARYAGISLGIHGGPRNVIRGNLVRDSRRDGFLVQKKDRHSLLKGNIARRAGDDGFEVNDRTTKLTTNRAVRTGDLGIEAVRGVNDGGGNVARHNGDPRQCTHVVCR